LREKFSFLNAVSHTAANLGLLCGGPTRISEAHQTLPASSEGNAGADGLRLDFIIISGKLAELRRDGDGTFPVASRGLHLRLVTPCCSLLSSPQGPRVNRHLRHELQFFHLPEVRSSPFYPAIHFIKLLALLFFTACDSSRCVRLLATPQFFFFNSFMFR